MRSAGSSFRKASAFVGIDEEVKFGDAVGDRNLAEALVAERGPARNAEYLSSGQSRLDAFCQAQSAGDSPAKADGAFPEMSERTLGCIDLCYPVGVRIEEGAMDRDQRVVRTHRTNDRRIKDRQGTRVERAAGMEAQLWRQDCEVPGGKIPPANCPLKVLRLPPQAQPVALAGRFKL